MAGGIFLIRDDGELIQFTAELYKTEDVLQSYVEQYPDLLAGDLIDAESPRRWVLVQREAPLAADEIGAGRWSVPRQELAFTSPPEPLSHGSLGGERQTSGCG